MSNDLVINVSVTTLDYIEEKTFLMSVTRRHMNIYFLPSLVQRAQDHQEAANRPDQRGAADFSQNSKTFQESLVF